MCNSFLTASALASAEADDIGLSGLLSWEYTECVVVETLDPGAGVVYLEVSSVSPFGGGALSDFLEARLEVFDLVLLAVDSLDWAS